MIDKFKIGDRVKVDEKFVNTMIGRQKADIVINTVGVVVDITPYLSIGVDFGIYIENFTWRLEKNILKEMTGRYFSSELVYPYNELSVELI